MSFDSSMSRDFQITAGVSDTRIVLRFSGELDATSAIELNATFNSYIENSHGSFVVDLSDLDFMDGIGLRVISDAARLLRSLNRTLILQSPSASIRRILDINGLADFIRIELGQVDPLRLGRVDSLVTSGTRLSGAESRGITLDDKTLLTIPISFEVLDTVLMLVVNLVKISLARADGVSVSLYREGQIRTVAASDQTVLEMDAGQYATQEGPCLDASTQGRLFHSRSLEEETRWPSFVPLAQSLGIRAIISNPLLAKSRSVGALNIYSLAASAFGNVEQRLSSDYAKEISALLTRTGVALSANSNAKTLHGALASREAIAQAQGIIMERENLDEEAAFDSLRRLSQDDDQTLLKHAMDIVDSTRRPANDADQSLGGPSA